MDISGQVALVTGAASGLGKATADRLLSLGAKVAYLDFNDKLEKTLPDSQNAIALQADITDITQVEQAFDTVKSQLGELPRIVVNCAGIGLAERILPRDGSLSVDLFMKTIQVNLVGTYIVLSVASRAMTQMQPVDSDGSRGVIINTASVAWQDGQIGQAAYAASKGGVVSLTLPAARELARFGIRVMTIAPGLFETAMSSGLPEEVRTTLEAGLPFPSRMGKPEEYAQLVQQIIENQILNGETIRLDSAVRLSPK